jgi:hypothetical protein
MFDLIFLGTLLTLGYVFGQIAEKRHYRSILLREQQLRQLLLVPSRFRPCM